MPSMPAVGPPQPAPEVDQLHLSQHAGAHQGELHVWCVLSIDEEHRHLGFGGDVDSPCKSHLCRVHRLHYVLDGRAVIYAHARGVGNRGWCPSYCLPTKEPLGLLVVVPRFHHSGGAGVLLHTPNLFVLAHGRFQLGRHSASQRAHSQSIQEQG